MNERKGAFPQIIAFVFGAMIALCTGILVIRHGVLVVANVVPPLVAMVLGSLCAALKIVHLAPALGWGVLLGALVIWAPITIVSYFFPIVFVPVLAAYAVLVPVSARITRRMLNRFSGWPNG